MLSCRRALVLALLALCLTVPARAGDDLASKIDAFIHGPEYREARWGILVVDAQTGETLYAHDAERLFLPASTTKLYSCAAALIALGPDHKFETPVYRRGTVTDGRLKGDLILVASGDLTLGGRTDADGKMAFKDNDHIYANGPPFAAELTDTDPLAGLKSLAKQVAAAGIKHVEGDVVIDERLFERSGGSGSGPAVVTPLVVNDNVVDLLVTPADQAGMAATVRMRPDNNYFQMDAQVTTVAEGKSPQVEWHSGGPQRFSVRGQVPVKSKPRVFIVPVEEPALWGRSLFIDCLRHEGVTVSASGLVPQPADLPENYDKLTRVALFTSPPLSEALKVTLKVSHNLYASTLPLLIAVKNGKRTLAEGLRAQRQLLADLGVDVGTIAFGGGAGGASADSVTPRATVQLLQGMAKRPDFAAYRASLPVLGVDGTLAEAVPSDSPVKGKVQAKTGTLMYGDVMNDRLVLRSKALAGVLTTAKGRELYVAMFLNDLPLPKGVLPSREGKALGRLCEIIYQQTPESRTP
jgi:D-alanyl-D-alanine carboxypeptidase/D-alanyl-D-alanine-endopeptidase (penicillin-binding protein 4)